MVTLTMCIDIRLSAIFARVLSYETALLLTMNSSTETVPGWDSTTYLAIILEIESEFGLELSTLDAARMNSVASICEVLREKGVALAL